MANQMHFYKSIIDDEIVITEPEQTFDGHFIPLLRRWDKKKKIQLWSSGRLSLRS